MTRPIAVSGVTGRLGGHVARLLALRGHPLRLVARTPGRAPVLAGAETVQASYADPDAVRAALTGVDVAFMVSGSESATRLDDHQSFVWAAAEAGVKHLVYTSFAAAGPDATFTLARDHWRTEEAIRATGMRFTFLRDNFYADFLPRVADDEGVIRGPAGDGRCSFVVRADVAEAAAAILASPHAHENAAYTLTGPDALTLTEAAALLTRATRRPYTFVDETDAVAYATRRSGWPGEPDWQYDAWVSTYTAIRSGELAPVTDDLPRLLGRAATPVATLFGA